MVAVGEQVDIAGLGRASVLRELGAGSAGTVFEVDVAGTHYALKVYRAGYATREQQEHIADLIAYGRPHHNFLWPIQLVEAPGATGYLLPLRPPEYSSFAYLVSGVDTKGRAVAQPDMRKRSRMAYETASAFRTLHGQGLCYRDISFGNLYVDPDSGAVVICDIDDVGVNGTPSLVMGTGKFMAPEILSGKVEAPSTATDQWSLAVLLFYVFIAAHPLEGVLTETEMEDEESFKYHFGARPVFCLDPSDDSNRPTAAAAARWQALPAFMRVLFTQAFVGGAADSRRRVGEGQWCHASRRIADSIYRCRVCSEENIVDFDAVDQACVACTNLLDRVSVLRAREPLVLDTNANLRTYHLDGSGTDLLGVVESHPAHPESLGLRNHSDRLWTAFEYDGTRHEIAPGKALGLARNVSLRIDGVGQAEIVVGSLAQPTS